ncbi:SDR family NAD(P)-dependent oxidoreductase [Bosea sp. (in: a-proteobacteria)]|uniref:SDR family NAD(P)-dependent oxidoreductase n=1 Tax=Bosea sp. (in: a-proteobacteria) TaxID=1871050 RepID=UPI003B3A299B
MLKGKVCLVTGAGSGLGRATSLLAAKNGAMIVAADVVQEAVEETVSTIFANGGQASAILCDVTDNASVEAMCHHALERFGGLDCAVNNAGIEGIQAPTSAYPEAEWNRVLAVNLTGVFLCLRAQINIMLTSGSGSIVNVASTAGLGGVDVMPAYTASKHGLIGLTKSAALAHAADNIRINAICPGSFHTPMSGRLFGDRFDDMIVSSTPMRRAGTLDEIAEAILWLCCDRSSFVTGVALPVEGGKRAR